MTHAMTGPIASRSSDLHGAETQTLNATYAAGKATAIKNRTAGRPPTRRPRPSCQTAEPHALGRDPLRHRGSIPRNPDRTRARTTLREVAARPPRTVQRLLRPRPAELALDVAGDVSYSRSPRASRASVRSAKIWARRIFPCSRS
jgi:hypothetical protein